MSSSKEMTARRALLRGRSTVTVATPQPHPNTETTTKATAVSRFIEVTRNALEALMQNHGYSRERAVSTLLEEIRSASAVNTTAIHHHHHHHPNSHPSDEVRVADAVSSQTNAPGRCYFGSFSPSLIRRYFFGFRFLTLSLCVCHVLCCVDF